MKDERKPFFQTVNKYINIITQNDCFMKAKPTFLNPVLVAMLLFLTSNHSFTINYTISFTASGVTTTVGNVHVKNLTKGTSVTVPNGNTLTLDLATGIDEIGADNEGIRILKNSINGKSTLTFSAPKTGNAQVAAFTLDGRKVVEKSLLIEAGDNSFELTLPAGMYLLRVSSAEYAYSLKLQCQTGAATQAGIKFLTNTKVEVPALRNSKAPSSGSISMSYTAGDKLLYTATSDTYVASVPDVPTQSKTTNFNFYAIPTSFIPSGTFMMGSPLTESNRDNDEAQYSVTLTSYFMSKYEITNTQYAAFLNTKKIGRNGLNATGAYPTQLLIYPSTGSYNYGLRFTGELWVPVAGYENSPVIYVTWYGAAEFATYLGGLLPTEAQWEYACRAGTTTPFNTGTCLTNADANYLWTNPYINCNNTVTTPVNKTQAVGTYASNAYGLYDMHGNVKEWCSDWYAAYPTTAQINPTGPATGSFRTPRGGSWYSGAQNSRSSFRSTYSPGINNETVGFRVIFVP